MRFILVASSNINRSSDDYKSDLKSYYDLLKDKGFDVWFETTVDPYGNEWRDYFVEIESLETLISLSDIVGCELIINRPLKGNPASIEIYDFDREC